MKLPASALALSTLACTTPTAEADGSVPGACATPAGAGTTHEGTLSADQHWTTAGRPHVVTFDDGVSSGSPPALLSNSLIADSNALGVNLVHSGEPVDFRAGNHFVNVASCKATTPRKPDGRRPSTVACP